MKNQPCYRYMSEKGKLVPFETKEALMQFVHQTHGNILLYDCKTDDYLNVCTYVLQNKLTGLVKSGRIIDEHTYTYYYVISCSDENYAFLKMKFPPTTF